MFNPDLLEQASDLGQTEFENAIIWLPALMRASLEADEPIIRGRTFRNCLFEGPAVLLALRGIGLEDCNLGWAGGEMASLLLRPVSPTTVVGTVTFEDCSFVACEFRNVGFTGSEEFIQAMLAVPVSEPQ